MERRDFLSDALIVGTGSVAIPAIGCAPTLRHAADVTLSTDEADELLARLSGTLSAARDARLVSDVVRAEYPDAFERMRDYLADADELAAKALMGLAIGDAGGSVPEGKLPDDRVRARLEELMPALDEQVVACAALLSRMPVREKRRVDDALRHDPEIPMRVGELLDLHAARVGITPSSRGKLRHIVSELGAWARAQPLSTISDQYVEKVRRVAAHRGEEIAFAREVAAHATVSALFARQSQQQSQATDSEVPPPRPSLPPVIVAPRRVLSPQSAAAPAQPVAAPPPPATPSGASGTAVGAAMMGLGGLVWGIGWGIGLTGGGTGWAVVGTVGAVVAIIGLIVLLVSAIAEATR